MDQSASAAVCSFGAFLFFFLNQFHQLRKNIIKSDKVSTEFRNQSELLLIKQTLNLEIYCRTISPGISGSSLKLVKLTPVTQIRQKCNLFINQNLSKTTCGAAHHEKE